MKHLVQRRLIAVQHSVVCHRKHVQTADGVDHDKPDDGAEENVFTFYNVVLVIGSMLSYAIDIFSSIAVCYILFINYVAERNPVWWFIIATLPLLISLVAVNCFSIRWYLHDMYDERFLVGSVSSAHWGLRIFFHLILLCPILRYLELLCYGLYSMHTSNSKRNAYKVLVLQEERDVTFLALVGSFIKSAPHLILELYILTQNKTPIGLTTFRSQITAIVASMVTLSLAMTTYHRALRRSLPSKLNMTRFGSTLQFVSHFCIIGSRVLVLAAFASAYSYWLFIFGFIHWSLMSFWLIYQNTKFCSTVEGEPRHCDELVFNAVMASIYMLCFINVKDEPTRWKYTFYYVIVCLQNLALTILWFLKTDPTLWYRLPLLIGVIAGFITGLVVLAVYYKFLHPNKISKRTTFIQVTDDESDGSICF